MYCEGLMVKTLEVNASYEPSKRSLNWLKVKKDYLEGLGDTVDLVPLGGYRGRGKRAAVFGAFLLAVYNPQRESYQTVCKAGTGFSDEQLQQHFEFLEARQLSCKPHHYEVHDKLIPDVWFDVCQVWECKAADLSVSPVHTAGINSQTPKGIGLRFPRFIRIRSDKNPNQATTHLQINEMYHAQFSGPSSSVKQDISQFLDDNDGDDDEE